MSCNFVISHWNSIRLILGLHKRKTNILDEQVLLWKQSIVLLHSIPTIITATVRETWVTWSPAASLLTTVLSDKFPCYFLQMGCCCGHTLSRATNVAVVFTVVSNVYDTQTMPWLTSNILTDRLHSIPLPWHFSTPLSRVPNCVHKFIKFYRIFNIFEWIQGN